MMRWKSLWSVLLVLGVSTGAMAATYTWTGDGDGTSWDSADNWSHTGVCNGSDCWPQAPGDDASINTLDCSACTIDLVTDTIDDLTIPSGNPTFDGNASVTTLTVDTLTAGNVVAAMSMTFTGGAKIAG